MKKSYFNFEKKPSVKQYSELIEWKNNPDNLDKRWHPGETDISRPGLVFQRYEQISPGGERWVKIQDYASLIFVEPAGIERKKSFYNVNRQLKKEEYDILIEWVASPLGKLQRWRQGEVSSTRPGRVFMTYDKGYPNGEKWRERATYKYKIRENLPNTDGRVSFFFVSRALTEEEFLQLQKWRKENPDLQWTPGDKRDNKDLYFFRYAKDCENGEHWKTFERFQKAKEIDKERRKTRYNNNFLYKMKQLIRKIVSRSFYTVGAKKDNLRSQDILGCTPLEFKKYIESKFEPWMNWENYGTTNVKKPNRPKQSFDIDHIIPLASANTLDELLALAHFSNLQPLCSYENRFVKKDRTDYYETRKENE